jgi:hypothetical protein
MSHLANHNPIPDVLEDHPESSQPRAHQLEPCELHKSTYALVNECLLVEIDEYISQQ